MKVEENVNDNQPEIIEDKNENVEKNEKVDNVPGEYRVKTLQELRNKGTEVIEFSKSGVNNHYIYFYIN